MTTRATAWAACPPCSGAAPPRTVVLAPRCPAHVPPPPRARTLDHHFEGEATTLAGSGARARYRGTGAVDGRGNAATFCFPRGIVVVPITRPEPPPSPAECSERASGGGGGGGDFDDDESSGTLYVSEMIGHRIRRISRDGIVSTLAGSGAAGFADGVGEAAQVRARLCCCVQWDIAMSGNTVCEFVCELCARARARVRARVRSVRARTRVRDDTTIRVVQRSPSKEASRAVAARAGGGRPRLDGSSHRRDTSDSGSPDADATLAVPQFNSPIGIALGPDGALYIADSEVAGELIRRAREPFCVGPLVVAHFEPTIQVRLPSPRMRRARAYSRRARVIVAARPPRMRARARLRDPATDPRALELSLRQKQRRLHRRTTGSGASTS